MQAFSSDKAIIQQVNFTPWIEMGVEVFVKREDLIDSVVSGNKWRKLKYNFLQAEKKKCTGVLSFGGAYSNHLHALARLGQIMNVSTFGVVRGEEFTELNQTLQDCVDMGMHLHFVSRSDYNLKNEKWFQNELREKFGNCFIVPEGGDNFYGFIGCQEILSHVSNGFTDVFCAMGTGTTFSGLVCSGYDANFYGVSALKGDFHQKDVEQNIENYLGSKEILESSKVHYLTDYHFGGFAKWNSELLEFAKKIYSETKIELDLIYNAKVWFALNDLIQKGHFLPTSKILLIHTGGLQGNRGFGVDFSNN